MTARRHYGLRPTPETAVGLGDWREQAACLDADPELFFPEEQGRSGAVKGLIIARAKLICASCSVIENCRADGDSRERGAASTHGIIAGETTEERKNRRRREARGASA